MKIAIDISPVLEKSGHKVRGAGFYIENLRKALLKYCPDNKYIFFTENKEITIDTDIVHYPYFDPFLLSLPIFKKYKTIITVHDLIPLIFPNNFPSGIKGKLKWQIQKLALKNSSAIITDSNSSKKDIVTILGTKDEKINVVYLAVSSEFKKITNTSVLHSMAVKYNLPEKFILYVGDVTWNKNLPRLIEAVKKLNANMVLVGKTLVEKNYDKKNPWNINLIKVQEAIAGDERLMCLGFIPTEDLVMIYNMAKVFVMPSIYEGFGLPVLEAMSCGCPVVTARCGSLSEIGGDAVAYVKEDDVNDIARKINNVFKDEKLQMDLSKKGLKQAEKFSLKKFATDTMEVYEKVFKG